MLPTEKSLKGLPTPSTDRLLAIVEVDEKDGVLCQQPGCGHKVYKRIHIVSLQGRPRILGSTCFAKQYGGYAALGAPHYGGTEGKRLSPEDRALLESNTAALLARFEAEALAAEEATRTRLEASKRIVHSLPHPSLEQARSTAQPAVAASISSGQSSPWPWAKPNASFAYFKLRDNTAWVRVTHQDGQQFLAPYPVFNGWDETLPPSIGIPDAELCALKIEEIVTALASLRRMVQWERIGAWRDIRLAIGKTGIS